MKSPDCEQRVCAYERVVRRALHPRRVKELRARVKKRAGKYTRPKPFHLAASCGREDNSTMVTTTRFQALLSEDESTMSAVAQVVQQAREADLGETDVAFVFFTPHH